ncbi:MAG: PAS domain S-box protein [Candidatus Omnitrophica bacterium]|nr:PAS domain S-box protein [Candidatus Omnitrophota bacterium]
MNKAIKIPLVMTFLFLFFARPLLAAGAENITGLSTQVVFIITIVVSIVFGLILTRIAAETRQAKGKIFTTKAKGRGELDPDEVLRELKNLSGSARSQKKAAMAISSLLEEKVEEKVTVVKQELTEKYGKLVEEKSRVAAEAQKKFKKTLTEKKQTEAIVRSVAAGVVVVNNKGEVLLMNPAAEKLLDTKKEAKIGRRLTEGAREEQLFSLVKSTSLDGETDIEIESNEDTKKILRSSSAVIEDENGQTVGMVTVLNDITKQKELDAMKTQFLSNVTHELRNPIGAIKQSISVILEGTAGELTEPQQKFLSNAKRNLDRLSALVDDILDLAKLEAKKMELNLKPTAMTTVINDVCETVDTWVKNKGISLVKNIEPNLPEINVDPDRVIQILMNIIGNAIKFTPKEGTITVTAGLSEAKDRMVLSVKDTGVGIAKDDLPKIFGKFQQAKNRSAGEKSGTGLGLTIAQELVELHGGKIDVESEEGKGTTFTFFLSMNLTAGSVPK